jgi:hypothetical protein
MDVLAEITAGMSWRRFSALLAGLSPDAMFRVVQRSERRVQHVSGAEAGAFFAGLGTGKKAGA